MDLIFRKSPQNADVDLYEYGVMKSNRKRSKTDLYVNPFGKMKSPKSPQLGERGKSKQFFLKLTFQQQKFSCHHQQHNYARLYETESFAHYS